MDQNAFDPSLYKWREVVGTPDLSYKVRHDYTVLGYNVAAGTLDMMVRWAGDGGHCPLHRHTATTTVLVIDGEQHLTDVLADGSPGEHKVRTAGDYALSVGDDQRPHFERGGEAGGLAFFGAHCADGRLYQLLDEDLKVIADVTIETLVADWQENA